MPLAYNKDMQEDKEAVFDALDTAQICLSVINTLLRNTKFNERRMAASLRGDFSTATDLADYLVRQNLPFRQAHEVVGKIVGECVRSGRALEDLTLDDLAAVSPCLPAQTRQHWSVRAAARMPGLHSAEPDGKR